MHILPSIQVNSSGRESRRSSSLCLSVGKIVKDSFITKIAQHHHALHSVFQYHLLKVVLCVLQRGLCDDESSFGQRDPVGVDVSLALGLIQPDSAVLICVKGIVHMDC